MTATSGTRVVSPVALRSSRVPAMVWVTDGVCWAAAGAPSDAAPSSIASHVCFIVLVLLSSGGQRSPNGHGWMMNVGEALQPAPSGDQAIKDEQNERANDCAD